MLRDGRGVYPEVFEGRPPQHEVLLTLSGKYRSSGGVGLFGLGFAVHPAGENDDTVKVRHGSGSSAGRFRHGVGRLRGGQDPLRPPTPPGTLPPPPPRPPRIPPP